MIVEGFTLYKTSEILKRENIGGLDEESILTLVVTTLWLLLWIYTISNAISCAKSKKSKNIQTNLILAALSWPIYWLYKITGVIC